jgi:hypothetical protein
MNLCDNILYYIFNKIQFYRKDIYIEPVDMRCRNNFHIVPSYKICRIKDIFGLLTINKSICEIIIYIIKNKYIICCDKNKQLAINLSEKSENKTKFCPFKINLHYVWSNNIDDNFLIDLKNIYSINLRYCNNITNLSMLENINTLILNNCFQLTDNCGISKLQHIRKLYLCATNISNKIIKDMSINSNLLKRIHTLDLSATNITNEILPLLINIHILYLRECNNITDVSALGNKNSKIYKLDLSLCNNIDDNSGISTLKNVKILYLRKCVNITDKSNISKLNNLKKLDLFKCENITNGNNIISESSNLDTLNLSRTGIIDVSMFGYIENLDLSYTNVNDVSKLNNVKTLFLNGTKINNNSGLSKLYNVRILDLFYTKVDYMSKLNNLKILFVDENQIKNISELNNIGVGKEQSLTPFKIYNFENEFSCNSMLYGLYMPYNFNEIKNNIYSNN